MNVHIINLFLSRNGGGIFTVINQLYSTKYAKYFFKKRLKYYGYKDNFTEIDTKTLNGKSFCFDKVNSFFYSKKMKLKLSEKLDNNSIIHLHSLWMYPSVLLIGLKRKHSFKKIISPHGMLDKWALNNSKFKKKISLFLFEKKNIRTADCIHALCYQEYLDIRKISSKVPVAIIPNGINMPISKNENNRPSNKNILFLARLHPKKGLDNLIEAWEKTNTENWNLIIVGPDEGGYEEKINKKNKFLKEGKNKIQLIKGAFGKEKEELYKAASIFILPSFSEGLPMTILEAWSYKLPVLMTKECNLEVGFNEKAAFQIEPTIQSIKSGIEKCINLPTTELEKMGYNGYKLVERDYTWEEVSKKMIKTYEWLLNGNNKPNFIRLN